MKKIVLLASLLMSLGATAAWAGELGERVCTAKFQGCEQSCNDDVVCQLRCWEERDGCSLRATIKTPKQTVDVKPYSVQLTVHFF